MSALRLGLLFGTFGLCALAGPAAARDLVFDTAILQGLDKSTARVVNVQAPVGQPVRFGTLEIVVRTCRKRPPEEEPESAAFLDIWENRPGQPATELFRSWMFASSPAVSALEHPVYDIWVLDCHNRPSGEAASPTSPNATSPNATSQGTETAP